MRSVFCRESHLHSGSLGHSNATVDGYESTADAAHAYCHTVVCDVPEIDRVRHEHPTEAHREAGYCCIGTVCNAVCNVDSLNGLCESFAGHLFIHV